MAKHESVDIQVREAVEMRDVTSPRINQIAPTQGAVDHAAVVNINPSNSTCGSFFKILFFAHLVVLFLLVSFLSIRGFLAKSSAFHPSHYFLPLLSSTAISALVALLWLLLTLRRPERSLVASFWLSPLLTCLASAVLLTFATGTSFAVGVPGIILGISQSLYACWVNPRIAYARQILSVSISMVKFYMAIGNYVALSVLAAAIYSWFWTLGVGGLAAAEDGRFDAIYILLMLLSLAWTMQVINDDLVLNKLDKTSHRHVVNRVDQ